jgi:hypothetical protein
MAGIGDRDFFGLRRHAAKVDRRCTRQRFRHRKAFAAIGGILCCRMHGQKAQKTNDDGKQSQHDGSVNRNFKPATVAAKSSFVMAVPTHACAVVERASDHLD